jgi:hypothetical protein
MIPLVRDKSRSINKNRETSLAAPFGLTVSGDYHPENRTVSRAWINIKTLEGTMRADIGDWIIKGVKGELYPCKPDIFEATYEPA